MKDRNLGPLLIILIVILVALGANWLYEHSWTKEPWNIGFHLEETASQGDVVEGFPAELVGLAKDTKVKTSAKYSLTDGGKDAEVLSATYDTAARIADLFGGYINYFSDHGYTVTKTDSKGIVSIITASRDGVTVSVNLYSLSSKINEVRVDVKRPVIQ